MLDVEDADDDKYRKIGSVRKLFEEFDRDYYKPKVINIGFAGEVNNYIKYMSEGDKDEKLSPNEYLNVIRPDLRDLVNKHKPVEELNNNNNTNNNNNNNNNNNTDNNHNNNTKRGEWKIMLIIYYYKFKLCIINIYSNYLINIIINYVKYIVFLLKVLMKHALWTQKVNK